MIESMNGGGFLNLTGEEAYKTLDELSDNSQRWDFSSRRGKNSTTTKKEGLYGVKDNEDIRGQLKDIMHTIEALALNKPVTAANIYQADVCSLCASPMHFTQNCPFLSIGAEYPPEQVNAFNDYRKPTNGPFADLQPRVAQPSQFLLEAKSTPKSRKNLESSSYSIFFWIPFTGSESIPIISPSPTSYFLVYHSSATASIGTTVIIGRNTLSIHADKQSDFARASEGHHEE
jgi:hypothetical protein